MRIYVAGPVADIATVRGVQEAVVAAGHELVLDWTQDTSLTEDAPGPVESAALAEEDLDAVLAADAVVVVASAHEGRGMYVELGAALARACRGELRHVVVVGEIQHESVFHFHPVVQRVASVQDWLRREL
ncbi:hypothetical protein [Nocardioides sp.]|jgi:nucleoside 2-deoxyribosyltransferase|uniref:hypothetical protein n=1 Tax=Nocardioides sp. TaxID=35761 RepID=UPI00262D817A|nr:hypothetical protein [Nocardioides sp.]